MNELEKRLKGTRKAAIIRELLTNSIHFPLANTILELLLHSDQPLDYIMKPDLYVLGIACVVQACFLGSWQYQGRSYRLYGNLIGPAMYSIFELLLEGMEFFESPNHIAYWGFSLALGVLQEIEWKTSGRRKEMLMLLEHVIRTNILLATYWIFELSHSYATFNPEYASLQGFLSDHSHQFITIVLFLLGLVVGFANITAANYLVILRNTAKELRTYSEWLFGRELLSQAMTDSKTLDLKRRERTVLFMDIRGFTSWSETKPPEAVVTMLNNYFETAEQLWQESEKIIKVKHTGDEIMAVFSTASGALDIAVRLREETQTFLDPYRLSAGIGIHSGQLVEGLIGSKDVKTYDIIGDTVNTAKRICDQAAGGEVLISQACYTTLSEFITVLEPRFITAKGKKDALQVYPVRGLTAEKTEN